MTPAEELRNRIDNDARNVRYAQSFPSDLYRRAAVIADCAKHYVEVRQLHTSMTASGCRDLELDAWENLVRALEGWR